MRARAGSKENGTGLDTCRSSSYAFASAAAAHLNRVGQNHTYTVYVRYFWQGNHQIYGHIRCTYTVLAKPTFKQGQ
jgi:hypothetical protein